MPVLQLQQPMRTRESSILVENQLGVGQHRFRLVVVNRQGVQSAPTDVIVEVRERVIGPINPRGPVVTGTLRGPTPPR